MKKIFAVLLLASITYAATAQQSNEEPFMTKSLSSESVQSATVKTTGGNISVEGVDALARIDVYVKASNGKDKNLSKADLQKRLDEDYDLNVSVSNHILSAIAKPKQNNRNWNNGLSISFKI